MPPKAKPEPSARLADLTPHLRTLCEQAKITDHCNLFIDWCANNGILSPKDIVLLCPKSELVDTTIIKRCTATVGLKEDDISAELAIKRVVSWCIDMAGSDDSVQEGQKIQPQVAGNLEAKWKLRHEFSLGTQKRVSKNMMQKLFGLLNSEPPSWEVISLASIVILGSSGKKTSSHMVKTASSSLLSQDVEYEETRDASHVYDKMRALLFSCAFVCVQNEKFFALQDVEDALEHIEYAMRQGYPANPLLFYSYAFEQTMTAWQRSIVTHGKTLADALKDTNSWVSFWRASSNPGLEHNNTLNFGNPSSHRQFKKLVNTMVFKGSKGKQKGFSPYGQPYYGRDIPKGGKSFGKDNGGKGWPQAGGKDSGGKSWNSVGGKDSGSKGFGYGGGRGTNPGGKSWNPGGKGWSTGGKGWK